MTSMHQPVDEPPEPPPMPPDQFEEFPELLGEGGDESYFNVWLCIALAAVVIAAVAMWSI